MGHGLLADKDPGAALFLVPKIEIFISEIISSLTFHSWCVLSVWTSRNLTEGLKMDLLHQSSNFYAVSAFLCGTPFTTSKPWLPCKEFPVALSDQSHP
jgi:hypothetical protein